MGVGSAALVFIAPFFVVPVSTGSGNFGVGAATSGDFTTAGAALAGLASAGLPSADLATGLLTEGVDSGRTTILGSAERLGDSSEPDRVCEFLEGECFRLEDDECLSSPVKNLFRL